MSVERNLIISLLKLSKEGPVLIESVNIDCKMPWETTWMLLEKLQNENLVYLKNDNVELDSGARLKLSG